MNTLASPTWQGILFLAVGLFLLWETWAGWRRGIVRSLLRFVALVFSGFVGVLAGQATAALVGMVFPGWALVAGVVTGGFITVVVLGLALILGPLFFKRKDEQQSRTARLIRNGGGAFFGLLTGLAIAWGGISLVRALGTLAEVGMAAQPDAKAPLAVRALAGLKESLELGTGGEIAKSVDVVPPQVYDAIALIGKLASDQDAIARFVNYPGLQEIIQHPTVARLLQDPTIVRAAQNQDFFALMQNKAVQDAVNDPSLQQLLVKFDLQKAMDYAFSPEQSPPPPENKP